MQNQARPPLIWFVFNRPDLTQKTLQGICEQTLPPEEIFVFSDEARNAQDEPLVRQVRKLVDSCHLHGIRHMRREQNYGCASNIQQGINEVLQTHPAAVILEEDTLPSRHFYETISAMLEFYSSETRVFSVGGYPSLLNGALTDFNYDNILSSRFSCWGWGVWASKWQDLMRRRKLAAELRAQLPKQPAWPDQVSMMNSWEANPNAYWDIPILLNALAAGYRHALTKQYLINNIGIASGVHGSIDNATQIALFMQENNRWSESAPRKFITWKNAEPWLNRFDDAISEYLHAIYQVSCPSGERRSLSSRLKHFIKNLGGTRQ